MKISYLTRMLALNKSPIVCHPPHSPSDPALIAIAGTQTARDLLVDDLDIRSAQWPPQGRWRVCDSRRYANDDECGSNNYGGVVHRGFARRTRALFGKIRHFVEEHDSFVLTGHSMGGACAVLMASLLYELPREVVGVYTFGMPRMASDEFRTYYHRTGLDGVSRHFTTPRDPVVYDIPFVYDAVGEYEVVPCDFEDVWMQHDMKAYDRVWNR